MRMRLLLPPSGISGVMRKGMVAEESEGLGVPLAPGPGKAALPVQCRLGGEGRRRRLCAPQADSTLDPVAMETALLSQMLLTLKSTQDGISPKITIRRSGF